jgi:hypothetical protein
MDNNGDQANYASRLPTRLFTHKVWYTRETNTGWQYWQRHCNCPTTVCVYWDYEHGCYPVTDTVYYPPFLFDNLDKGNA